MRKIYLILLLLAGHAFAGNRDVIIDGATDNTQIGNASDGLKINLRNAAGTETGTSSNPLRNDPTGTTVQPVAIQSDSTKVTYSASASDVVTAALATDVFTITGSATKTIRITRIAFSGTETTGGIRDISVIKRSTANSGGTSTTITAVPHDSNDAAATATVRAYTANPTLGTTVGLIRAAAWAIPATNLSGQNSILIWDFGDRPAKTVVLRGTSEVLAFNFDATTISGSNFEFSVEWTEE